MITLASCPRCHGHATVFVRRFGRYGIEYAVGCKDNTCNVNTTFMPKSLDAMAERWNAGVGLVRAGEPIECHGAREMHTLEVGEIWLERR